MTAEEKLDALLEGQASLAVVVGRIDRELQQHRNELCELFKIVEMTQETVRNILEEVQRPCGIVTPFAACRDREEDA